MLLFYKKIQQLHSLLHNGFNQDKTPFVSKTKMCNLISLKMPYSCNISCSSSQPIKNISYRSPQQVEKESVVDVRERFSLVIGLILVYMLFSTN